MFIYDILFIHSSIGEHLNNFLLVIVNNAEIDISVQISAQVSTFNSFGVYIEEENFCNLGFILRRQRQLYPQVLKKEEIFSPVAHVHPGREILTGSLLISDSESSTVGLTTP
jgi:hypothetical protein